MVVNRATGERYAESILGTNIILVSSTSGIKRVVDFLDRRLFTRRHNKNCTIRARSSETEVIPELVRSLYLETVYLEKRGQKVPLSF